MVEGDSRTATFLITDSVDHLQILGGFNGGEKLSAQRNPNFGLNRTVLSCDLDQNDNIDVKADNCYHVITAIGTSLITQLERLTITGGYANGDSAANK